MRACLEMVQYVIRCFSQGSQGLMMPTCCSNLIDMTIPMTTGYLRGRQVGETDYVHFSHPHPQQLGDLHFRRIEDFPALVLCKFSGVAEVGCDNDRHAFRTSSPVREYVVKHVLFNQELCFGCER